MIRYTVIPVLLVGVVASCGTFGEADETTSSSSSGSTSSSSSASGSGSSSGTSGTAADGGADGGTIATDSGIPLTPGATTIEDNFDDGTSDGWLNAGGVAAHMTTGPSPHYRFATLAGIDSFFFRQVPRKPNHNFLHVEVDVHFEAPLPPSATNVPVAAILFGAQLFGMGTRDGTFSCFAGDNIIQVGAPAASVVDGEYHRFRFDVRQESAATTVMCSVDDHASIFASAPIDTRGQNASLYVGAITKVSVRVDIDNVLAISDQQ